MHCQREIGHEFRARDKEQERNDCYETRKKPRETNGPADGGVAADGAPVENQLKGEFLAEYEGGEDD